MTRTIQTLNAISRKGLARLPEAYSVSNDATAPDAILVRSQAMHELPIPDSVLAIGRAGAGTNNIPVAAISERGVVVFNAPGANANAVKELVIAGMLMGTRNLFPALRFVSGLEVAEVAAEVGSIVPGHIVHDYAGAMLRLANGARGSFWVTQAAAGVERHVFLVDLAFVDDEARRRPLLYGQDEPHRHPCLRPHGQGRICQAPEGKPGNQEQ